MAVTIEHDGLLRSFDLHLPPDWMRRVPLPVVLAFHPEGGTASAFMVLTRLREIMASVDTVLEDKFVLIVPQGVGVFGPNPIPAIAALLDSFGDVPSWNSGHRGRGARDLAVDDVGFTEAALAWVSERMEADRDRVHPGAIVPVLDTSRIYALGLENGGMFCYRLAKELPSARSASRCARSRPWAGRSAAGRKRRICVRTRGTSRSSGSRRPPPSFTCTARRTRTCG